ncbi:PREDICTED: uncharacterized protein LOC109128898 [Camelina sativa]|uniref:Uncharacterized protein LOC104703430 n=1 Tax=Camelina sativa TaxID=90675 RepID=A0ABM1QY19_CAMSA|nr:PREDICTED: uncharacterized protein LOC104703430 [Camelina sativa]XP_010457814.1 PREDICTED: uncharacterized protein LOC104739228 [Camelina sativa]XP_019091657.1 PREDICTED: uncharacterized protein LOC109128898 [Camelina sativa]
MEKEGAIHNNRADGEGVYNRADGEGDDNRAYGEGDEWENVKGCGDDERAILALKNFEKGVYDALMMKNPHNCSRAFFTCASMCEDVSNNFSESYNNAINQAREMPLVEMLERLRRQCMIRNAMRKKKAMSHQGKFSLKVAATITKEQKHMLYCQVVPCGNGHYEVTEHGQGFRVDMNAKTCACRRWSMTGIPCRHVLRIILKKKLKPEDFVVSDWYLTTRWVKQYNETLMGVNGMCFWEKSGESRLQPPPRQADKGPKKKQKRIKGKNESPQKKKKKKNEKGNEEEEPAQKKLTREGMKLHCGRCGLAGHNIVRCNNIGVPVKRPPKKQSQAGPSQINQTSQSSQPSQASQAT